MGFWHTGYIEFHEPTGLQGEYHPIPTIYQCQHCGKTFATSEDLRAHRFAEHPYQRPCLFVRGVEIGTTPVHITKPIYATDINCMHSRNAWINDKQIELDELSDDLASYNNDTLTVRLENEGISADFKLIYEIARIEDLDGIDQCFLNVARRGNLDKRSIEEFIAASKRFPTAIRYCDGICEYFYGVLAKERSVESSLEYSAYLEKFNRAEDLLKDYDRRLSLEVCALVSFHFNHFVESSEYTTNSRASLASEHFLRWINGTVREAWAQQTEVVNLNLERLLTDYETEKLLNWMVMDWSELSSHVCDIESLVKRDALSDLDRSKLRILLAEYYLWSGDIAKARYHARNYRNDMVFGMWAERVLKQKNPQG